MQRVLLLDNHDSFTWNLAQYLAELGAEVDVRMSDAIALEECVDGRYDAFVVSPGPGRPENAGISLDLVRAAAERRMPLLGVCLGHQALGQAYGARVVHAPRPVHGKTSRIEHDGTGVFAGLPPSFEATRYHSLVVEEASLPDELAVTARSEDGLVMGLAHRDLPLHGVQFHPESVLTLEGHRLLRNFLDLALPRARSREEPMPITRPFNLKAWIDENRELLKPPVGNKMVWRDSELLVMVVGGPNQRKDFHVEEGEEFFYQIEGDIVVRVIEDGKPRDIPLREGEIFLLPPRVPHSPQRPANTVGLVIERVRKAGERDHLVWFCESCGETLHDASFQLEDLGKQLKPIIEGFYADETTRTCRTCGAVMTVPGVRA